jgi:hypothetical protein
MRRWLAATTSSATIRPIIAALWRATRIAWFVSRVTPQPKVVGVSRHAILINYNMLIRQPCRAGGLNIGVSHTLNRHAIAELCKPSLTACIGAIHHWVGNWLSFDTLMERRRTLTQPVLRGSVSHVCRASLFISSRLTNFVNRCVKRVVEFPSSCWRSL